MDIPAVFARHRDSAITLSEVRFRRTIPMVDGPTHPLSDIAGKLDHEKRMPLVVVDMNSLTQRFFCEKIMKHLRVRGAYLWMMTYIETADDLFDAFNGNAEAMISPYHASLSDADLMDILDVSDSFIPAVYAVSGMGIRRKGRKTEIENILGDLRDMGFYRTCVIDTDMSVSEEKWRYIADEYPSAMPFPVKGRIEVPGVEFNDSIVPISY